MSTKKKNNQKNAGFKILTEFKPKTVNQHDYVRSIVENDVTFCTGPAGCGKAQPLTSKILTPDGFITLKNLKVGDLVSTPDGETAEVLRIFYQGIKDVYKVTFSDGTSTLCCKEHLWTVESPNNFKGKKTYSLEELMKGGINTSTGKKKYRIPTTAPVHLNSQDVSIDPYTLGLLIGDGCLKDSVRFSTNDNEIIQYLESTLDDGHSLNYISKSDYRISKTNSSVKNNTYISRLKEYNLYGKLSYNKFVPKEYLYNSIEVRLSVLQGLLDTDGSVSKNGFIEYTTTSKQLSEDVIFLVQSLGGLARSVARVTSYSYLGAKKQGMLSFRVYIRFNNDIQPFRLQRKLDRLVSRTKYQVCRYIERVDKISREECACIYIDSDEHLYMTNDCIVTHNTACAVGLAASWLSSGKISKIIITRPIVETGRKGLGFLPGSMQEKIHPYLIPILDEFERYFDTWQMEELIRLGVIDIAPLEYMRGRNFHNCFMLLDEAQNTTFDQLKMFMTRIGQDSKCVINGDLHQSDLKESVNALGYCMDKLEGTDGVGICELTREDILRSGIISRILSKLED